MTNDSNTSYWLATAPDWPAAPTALPDQAELVVLGAGIMGAATAYWLARLGVPALVLERNPAPSRGATGRNAGMHVPGAADGYADTVDRLGRAAARTIMQTTETNLQLLEDVLAREHIDAGYHRTGLVDLAPAGDEGLRTQLSAALLREDGFAADWLNRAEAETMWGTALGPNYVGAMYNPKAGAFHSARYTQGVTAAAQRLGAQFHFDTPVTAVVPEGEAWQVLTTRGAVRAAQVVVAVNAWAGELFPALAPVLTPVRGHILVTEPVAGLEQMRPWSANSGYEYGRRLPDGRLLIGGQRRSRADREEGYPPAPGQNAPPIEPAVVAAIEAALPQIIPAAAGAVTSRHWSGVMDFSPDHQPLIGAWPGRRGLWLLVGFSGHGMAFSQVLPYGLAAQITGGDGPAVPATYAPARLLG